MHGLDRVPVNCDRVFNLFCLYGNVKTVKILRDDKVLVELEDAEAARRCVSNLHMLQVDDEVNMKVKWVQAIVSGEQSARPLVYPGGGVFGYVLKL